MSRSFVMKYAHYSSELRKFLTEEQRKIIDRICWEEQDGYGIRGHTPIQGWDWSGIRDSTPSAFRKMKKRILVEVLK